MSMLTGGSLPKGQSSDKYSTQWVAHLLVIFCLV